MTLNRVQFAQWMRWKPFLSFLRVLRRVVKLLSGYSVLEASNEAGIRQAQNASKQCEELMAENKKLKEVRHSACCHEWGEHRSFVMRGGPTCSQSSSNETKVVIGYTAAWKRHTVNTLQSLNCKMFNTFLWILTQTDCETCLFHF